MRESVPERIGASADEFRTELVSRAEVFQRPTPDVWSALEYGCHVRDVFRRFDRRLERMLAEDDPRFENWDQDATAVDDRYGEQDAAAGGRRARRRRGPSLTASSRSGPTSGSRPGRRSDGARFTVESLGRYLLHDLVHHVHDITGRRFEAG